ncbi:N-acetylmuramoyl-L-alanine amidase [Cesiribacter sp. SM1]|uniref:N-acetylmuramoyl-L-alanine amidase n=1 Tax=Cesiribacter sp. SM1 TaxID=2861196 RepID=UPI001CD4BD6E|nr:N-acetylmuramoyl-L-alanine amidase [Cesiribacter sp. SM1]
MKYYGVLTFFLLLAAVLSLISCSRNPYAATNRAHKKQVRAYIRSLKDLPLKNAQEDSILQGDYWVGTTNFNLRKPNYVVIHYTAQESTEHTLNTFTEPATSVSSHYVIGGDGKVYQMLNDYFRAWHGGAGKWGNTTDLNSGSIGIELDNNGTEPFEEAQIQSLLRLLARLKKAYSIPAGNFIGHSDIAPTRKVDPGPLFPWKRLAEQGYGLWPYKDYFAEALSQDSALVVQSIALLSNIPMPAGEQITDNDALREILSKRIVDAIAVEEALRIIGYDISDIGAAVRAFKLHYIQKDVHAPLTDEDKIVLYNVYKRSL